MKKLPSDICAVLFDLDNTLIDTKGADWIACGEVCAYLQKLDVDISYASQCVETFYKLIRTCPEDPVNPQGDVDEWRTLLFEQALGPSFCCYARDAYLLWKESRAKYLVLSPKVQSMLHQLKYEGFKLAIITNGPSEAQWEKVKRIGIDHFDAIVVGGDFVKQKPHPMVFEEAYKRLDVLPEQCVMVGDRLETDIQGGINGKVAATIWVTPSHKTTVCANDRMAGKPKPDFRIGHVCELLDLINQS